MSDYYPFGISHKDFQDDKKTYVLNIDDVLSCEGYVNVKGVQFDCHASASLTRTGLGYPELASLEIRSVYVMVGEYQFRVDQNEDWGIWKDKVETEVGKRAIKIAEKSMKWESLDDD